MSSVRDPSHDTATLQEHVGVVLLDSAGRVAAHNETVRGWANGLSLWGRAHHDAFRELERQQSWPGPVVTYPVTLYGPRGLLGTLLIVLPEGESLDRAAWETLNAELQAIIDANFDEIHVTDGHGTTLRTSSKSHEFFGLHPDEMVGMSVDELESRGVARPLVTRLVVEKKRRVTAVQETVTGRRLVVTGLPVFDSSGTLIRVVNTSRDITGVDRLTDELEAAKSVVRAYQQELDLLRQRQGINGLFFRSGVMEQLVATARRVAEVDCTALILGETGVGKEVLARYIHDQSPRSAGPFVAINCGAIPESLIESELFGYAGGAFTGARREGKIGLIEAAHGGTLFLDEIGDLPLNLQVRLLRVIQEREVTRVGRVSPVKVDVRIIAATNQDLEQMTLDGRFRQDLYYRLNVVPLTIPPLRERPDDILPLCTHFLEVFGKRYQRPKRLSPAAVDALTQHTWPGNVRELENLMERLVVTVDDETIGLEHLPASITRQLRRAEQLPAIQVNQLVPLKEAVTELETQLIGLAYERYQSSYRVADLLGIHQSTVIRKLRRIEERATEGSRDEDVVMR